MLPHLRMLSSWLLFLSLAPTAALACEGPTHTTQCHLDERDDDEEEETFIEGLDFRFGGESTALPSAVAWGVAARATARKGAWLGAEGRWTGDGRWTSRISTGLDVLGSSPWDLRGGLFIGNVGVWQTEQERVLMIGTELAAGATFGRVFGELRFIGGKRPAEKGVRSETDISLGYRLVDELRVHGHWMALNSGPGERSAGVGLGASYTF